jgi:hypothetical protein
LRCKNKSQNKTYNLNTSLLKKDELVFSRRRNKKMSKGSYFVGKSGFDGFSVEAKGETSQAENNPAILSESTTGEEKPPVNRAITKGSLCKRQRDRGDRIQSSVLRGE